MTKKNETLKYNFTVKDTLGEPFITIQAMEGEMSVLKNALLIFNLKNGATKKEAWEVAEKLNKIIESLTYQEI